MSSELATINPMPTLANISKDDLILELLRRQAIESKEIAESQKATVNTVREYVQRVNLVEDNLNKKFEKDYFLQFKKHSSDYVTITTLGEENNPQISRERMRKLLQWASILRSGTSIEPYSERMSGQEPLVIKTKEISRHSGREYWQWWFHNYRTWSIVKNKMHREQQLNSFLACKSKKEIDEFIDYL